MVLSLDTPGAKCTTISTSAAVLSSTLRILIFVPIYAASNIKVKASTFYPPLVRGIILNVILAVVFTIIRRIFGCWDIKTFVIAIAISAFVGYIIGLIILSDKEDRQKLTSMLKKR